MKRLLNLNTLSNKKNAQTKSWELTEDLSLEYSLSDALRDCSREVREKPGYTGVFATKTK